MAMARVDTSDITQNDALSGDVARPELPRQQKEIEPGQGPVPPLKPRPRRRHLRVVNANYNYLLDVLDPPDDGVADHLVTDGVFTLDDIDYVINGGPDRTRRERARRFITLLKTRGTNGYTRFLHALRNTGSHHIADRLSSTGNESMLPVADGGDEETAASDMDLLPDLHYACNLALEPSMHSTSRDTVHHAHKMVKRQHFHAASPPSALSTHTDTRCANKKRVVPSATNVPTRDNDDDVNKCPGQVSNQGSSCGLPVPSAPDMPGDTMCKLMHKSCTRTTQHLTVSSTPRPYGVQRSCEETSDFMDPQVLSAMLENFSDSEIENDAQAIKTNKTPAPVIFQNCTFSNVQFVL